MKGFKVVLIGDSGVGKTTIYDRLETGVFNENQSSTIGGAFMRINAPRTDQRTVALGVWDTAGQERYKTIIPVYFERSNFVLLVYDITSRPSFEHIPDWLELCREKVPLTARFVLVGNKCDLVQARAVPQEDALAYAARIGALFHMETSAKTAEGLDALLQGIADEAVTIDNEDKDVDHVPAAQPKGFTCC
jgi:small GTP-binding protein